MEKSKKNIDSIESNEKMIKLIDCIHQFSQKLIETKTEEDIYRLLVEDLPNQMKITDYAMYTVNPQTKELKNIVSQGDTKSHGLQAIIEDESVRTQFGISTINEYPKAVVSPEINKNKFKIISHSSEMIVPIVIKGVVSAVIVGRYSNQNTLTEPHRKLWEAVTALAGGGIIKLRERNELQQIKFQLENSLEEKDADLEEIIDILSSKNSELKYYNEKQKELIQELHHRVTNNLQTISSIIRLYKYENKKDSLGALKEIYDRVQILAIIYQNIYKSMEKDCPDVEAFLHDMISYLKATSNNTIVKFHIQSEVRCLNFNILISLGLFVAEVFYAWLEKVESSGINHIKFNISIKGSSASSALVVNIRDEEKMLMENLIDVQSSENISDIMISGLVDQLEGEVGS